MAPLPGGGIVFHLSHLCSGVGAPGETPRLLSPALFRSRVVPVLLRLFAVHEEHVRTVLLSHLEAYVEHFSPEQLRTVILPQVSSGRRLGQRRPETEAAWASRSQSCSPCFGLSLRKAGLICQLGRRRQRAGGVLAEHGLCRGFVGASLSGVGARAFQPLRQPPRSLGRICPLVGSGYTGFL